MIDFDLKITDELFTTKEILQQDYDITIASRDVEIAQGMLGARVKVDLDIRDVNVDDAVKTFSIGEYQLIEID